MSYLTAYVATFVVFLVIDYFGLSYLLKPMFERHIGHLMLENFRVLPAFLFYAFLVAVILWFVSAPALTQGHGLGFVFLSGALLGAACYGTYEFTNFAIMRDWVWQMVVVDVIWGTVLTGFSAMAGVAITRALVA